MNEKHSAVCYIFRDGAFSPIQEAKSFQNEFGLDLFQYKGAIYEGRTGLCLCNLQQSQDLSGFMERHGGLESIEKQITNSLGRTGLSPRYTRPNEKKKDIFPPKERDENRVFSKDLMGKRHYYYRFYNENGIELYTLENKRDSWPTIFIPCDGFMVGIDQRSRLAEVLKWLSTLRLNGSSTRVWRLQIAGPILALPTSWGGAKRLRHTTLPFGQSANGKPNCERQNWKPRRVSVNKSYKTAIPPPSERRSKTF